jgi:hypothetical protein
MGTEHVEEISACLLVLALVEAVSQSTAEEGLEWGLET